MPGTPLPSVDSNGVQSFAHDGSGSLRAYQTCLKYERQLAATKTVRFVRIIGYFLFYAPNQGVREQVTKCIDWCKNRTQLVGMGQFFETYVIIPFKKYRGKTPASSKYASSSLFRSTEREMEATIVEAPKSHEHAKKEALVRDNWRCVVTGFLHHETPQEVRGPGLFDTSYTECAHIIPEAVFFSVGSEERNARKREYSAFILAVLERFRYDISRFNGERVHSLTNVMTIDHNVHEAFDRLELYFEAVAELGQNTYAVKTFEPSLRFQSQHDFVTFTTENAATHPVPSPELLMLHATCCKVAHCSGSAEYIDTLYKDSEEIGVLASDGTSKILRYKLLPLVNHMTRVGT